MPYDSSQVYQPEEDTCLLLDAALSEVKPGDRVLEIGTGSGVIAAELAKVTNVVATDINPHAVSCAKTKRLEVVQADLFCGITGLFDLVVFNPPYLPTAPEDRIDDWLEYALDGGSTGRMTILRFADEVDRVLSTRGRILLLISSLTGLPEVRDLFFMKHFASEIVLKRRVEDEDLYVLRLVRQTCEI